MGIKDTKRRFDRKDKNVHNDGIRRIHCPGGISEKDVDTYFDQVHKEWGHTALADQELRERALQLLRAHKAPVFRNAELTVVGAVVAIRFVAGKGRRKFRIEPAMEEIKVQVHVENLVFGCVRVVLFLACLLETVTAFMSVGEHFSYDTALYPTSVIVVMIIGDVARGTCALVAGLETVNSEVSLFASVYGRRGVAVAGEGDAGTHGVGLFLVGPRRWLFRAALYALVAARGRVHLSVPLDYVLVYNAMTSGRVFSCWVLAVGSLLSLGVHVTLLLLPSLLKAPWSSINPPPSSPPLSASSAASGAVDAETATPRSLGDEYGAKPSGLVRAAVTKTEVSSSLQMSTHHSKSSAEFHRTDNLVRTAVSKTELSTFSSHSKVTTAKKESIGNIHTTDGSHAAEEESGEEVSRCRGCLSRVGGPRRPCSVSLVLQSVAVSVCITTALTLFVCHVIRLVQSFVRPSTFNLNPMDTLPSISAATLLCATVLACHVFSLARSLFPPPRRPSTSRSSGPPTAGWSLRATLFLHVAAVSSAWSHHVVSWLAQVWSVGTVGVALVAFTATALALPLAPLALRGLLHLRRARGGSEPGCSGCIQRCCGCCCSCLGRRPRSCPKVPLESLQRLIFMLAVALAVSGMCLAVMSLPLPVARVQSQYKEELLEGVQELRNILSKAEDHWNKLLDLTHARICGGKDTEQLRRDLKRYKQAAASMTLGELRKHCDDMGLREAIRTEDLYCQSYGATKLYFAGDIAFNASLLEHQARVVKENKFDGDDDAEKKYQAAKDGYLREVIDASRNAQLRTLDAGDTSLAPGALKTNEDCLTAMCIAQTAALVAMLIPFAGIAVQVGYQLLMALDAVLRIMIKLSKIQYIFLDFKLGLDILNSKFLYYEEEKTIQFSLANFNLIYLSYPALLTGCVGVLVGFWHRKAAATSHRRRASLFVLLPLIFFNLFGLGTTYAWTHIVSILGESAPMISMTVTPLAAVKVLRLGYFLVLAACILFLLLALLHQRHLRQAAAKAPPKPENNADIELKTTACLQATVSEKKQLFTASSDDTAAEDTKTAKRKQGKGVKVTRGVTRSGTTWVLALLFALASAGVVTVIMWKPVFAVDLDLNTDLKDSLKRVQGGVEASTLAKLGLHDENADRCGLVNFVSKHLLQNYMNSLNKMIFTAYETIFEAIQIKAKITFLPAMQLIQIPLLLAVYAPLAAVLWGTVSSRCCPALTPSPRICARLASTMAWLSVGWLVNAVLFLTSVAHAGVVPLFSVQVYAAEGISYVMAANVGLLLVSQELRIGIIAPVL